MAKYCTDGTLGVHKGTANFYVSPSQLYFLLLCNQPMSSATTELQPRVFAARFLLSFPPSAKENSRKTAVIAAGLRNCAQRSCGVEAPERSSLLPEQWLPCSPLIDPPLGCLWRGKTTCWLHAYNLLRTSSL